MKLKPFKGPGSTPSRRRFWDTVTQAVIASQKVAGQNVTVDEHPGKGSVINVPDSHRGQGTGTGTGACCTDGECSILSESDCVAGGGNFMGVGTTCDDVDCTQGACCLDGDCSITTASGCAAIGGTYQGDDTTCDPNPCVACHETIRVDMDICFTRVNITCCLLTVMESVTFDLILIDGCPIDYETSGIKYTTSGALLTTAMMVHRSPYPDGCDPDLNCSTLFNVADAFVDIGSLGLFWDAGSMEWSFQPTLHFPHPPAGFSAPSSTFTGDPVGQFFNVTSGDPCPSGDENSLDITTTFSLP